METENNQISVESAIASAYSADMSISLDRIEMTFLVGIHAFLKSQKETTITVGTLKNLYNRINTLIFGHEENAERRAMSTITKLREQSFISKMGGVEGNLYVLSPLGQAIGQHWEKTELLTQRNLNIYTSQLRLLLDDIVEHAKAGGDDMFWHERVSLPLREIVAEIIDCIRHRQDGMRRVQADIEREITEKLRSGWAEAIEVCENMLKKTGAAIKELHTLLLQETDNLLAAMDILAALAQEARQRDSMDAVETVQSQIETIKKWADHSAAEWTKYHGNVLSFINTTVRSDPNRNIAYRLRDAINVYFTIPWTFSVCRADQYLCLREGAFIRQSDPIDITGKISRAEVSENQDADNTLLNNVIFEIEKSLTETGAASLITILRKFMPELTMGQTYALAGELVALLAERGYPFPLENNIWTEVDNCISLQDLTVLKHGN
ncbi:MAG: hypothetical protein AB9919_13225 [Geobacteraceae bacterium]